jgi:hypothetical protein
VGGVGSARVHSIHPAGAVHAVHKAVTAHSGLARFAHV